MILVESLVCIVLIVLSLNIKNLYSGYSDFDKRILNRLCLFHFLIGIIFIWYISANGGDAQAYWAKAQRSDLDEILYLLSRRGATGVIVLLNYIPANVFQLSFFGGSLFYIALGYWGVLLFYNVIKENVPNYMILTKIKVAGLAIFPTLLFLPNLHFWSSGLGKDTILFFCIALFVYSSADLKRRLFGVGISILLAIFIRPHIVLFLLIAYGMSTIFDQKVKGYQKALLVTFLSIVFISLFSYVMNFVQLESFDASAIEAYSDKKAEVLSKKSGSGVDISNYPYPLKVFTFLFRPLFFDINNALAVVSSFENLLLLLFSIKVLRSQPIKSLKVSSRVIKVLVFFFVIGSLTFSLILSNFGIILRQKVPFIFSMIIFSYAILAISQLRKNYAFRGNTQLK